jgi:hypothetical protein
MQRELPAINFRSQAEVRSEAEYRRTEEITGLLRGLFGRWTTKLRSRKPIVFSASQYAQISARAGNRGLTAGQS